MHILFCGVVPAKAQVVVERPEVTDGVAADVFMGNRAPLRMLFDTLEQSRGEQSDLPGNPAEQRGTRWKRTAVPRTHIALDDQRVTTQRAGTPTHVHPAGDDVERMPDHNHYVGLHPVGHPFERKRTVH
jgi:hypothetical protein